MAANRTRTARQEHNDMNSSDMSSSPYRGYNIQKRQSRVTVKYNRKALQRRLDVEKWIDDNLNQLYSGQEDDIPEEVNIDDLIDLPNGKERVKKLHDLLQKCPNNTETFIRELVVKLEGVHKQEDLQTEGIEHPIPPTRQGEEERTTQEF
uniref:Uncharacterized protein n=1 Tax=Mola mola TaxID=94237 RepID=A0A3Q3W1G7_MOLML